MAFGTKKLIAACDKTAASMDAAAVAAAMNREMSRRLQGADILLNALYAIAEISEDTNDVTKAGATAKAAIAKYENLINGKAK